MTQYLHTVISADSSGFTRATGAASASVSSFAQSLGGATALLTGGFTLAAAAGFAAANQLATGFSAAILELQSLSRETELSINQLQDLASVSSRTLESFDNLMAGAVSLQSAIEADSSAFSDLGVAVRNSVGEYRELNEVQADVLNSLASISDETERANIAQRLYNESAETYLRLVEENPGAFTLSPLEQARRFTTGDEQAAQALTREQNRFGASTQAIQDELGAYFTPGVTSFTGALADGVEAIERFVRSVTGRNQGVPGEIIRDSAGNTIGQYYEDGTVRFQSRTPNPVDAPTSLLRLIREGRLTGGIDPELDFIDPEAELPDRVEDPEVLRQLERQYALLAEQFPIDEEIARLQRQGLLEGPRATGEYVARTTEATTWAAALRNMEEAFLESLSVEERMELLLAEISGSTAITANAADPQTYNRFSDNLSRFVHPLGPERSARDQAAFEAGLVRDPATGEYRSASGPGFTSRRDDFTGRGSNRPAFNPVTGRFDRDYGYVDDDGNVVINPDYTFPAPPPPTVDPNDFRPRPRDRDPALFGDARTVIQINAPVVGTENLEDTIATGTRRATEVRGQDAGVVRNADAGDIITGQSV